MINEPRLIEQFLTMVAIGSESFREKALRDYLQSEFLKRGLEIEEDDAARLIGGNCGNLLVRVPGNVNLSPLLLSAHLDTVTPGENIQAVVGEDGCIRSTGPTILAADDKAGIAAILEVLDVLAEENQPRPPLEILLTVCEEQGLLGARHFDFTRLKSRIGYTLDSDGAPGGIVVKSPAQNEINYKVYGRAAHAGMNPEDGINAIQVMAYALSQMPCGRIDPETTCNFGMIDGGQARNIVAEYCHVQGEARSLNPQRLESLTEELQQTFITAVESRGARAAVEVNFLYPAVVLDHDEPVVSLAAQAAEQLDLPVSYKKTGGGSDAAVIYGHGIRCANLAMGMRAAHTQEEHIYVNDLINVVKWVLTIIDHYVKEGLR
ncbi:MAG TPA: M20/M25/M40 family metallo-hydrolase [Syntrophomonadaceae bacterium]|nr:M20/M25/M40 family metallo-hydrolase [Syntrophomonadaceae bacterium]